MISYQWVSLSLSFTVSTSKFTELREAQRVELDPLLPEPRTKSGQRSFSVMLTSTSAGSILRTEMFGRVNQHRTGAL